MKIDNAIAQTQAQQAYAAAFRGKTNGAGAVSGSTSDEARAQAAQSTDKVQISSQGRLRAQALDTVRNTPETRSKLVLDLRSQIAAGTFKVDENSLAQQLGRNVDLRS